MCVAGACRGVSCGRAGRRPGRRTRTRVRWRRWRRRAWGTAGGEVPLPGCRRSGRRRRGRRRRGRRPPPAAGGATSVAEGELPAGAAAAAAAIAGAKEQPPGPGCALDDEEAKRPDFVLDCVHFYLSADWSSCVRRPRVRD